MESVLHDGTKAINGSSHIRVGEIVFSIESADNANGNLINAWLDTVPSEAYHPFGAQ